MMEMANCAKIQIEALYCEYEPNIVRIYAVDEMDRVGILEKPHESLCNDPETLIVVQGVYGGLRRPIAGRFPSDASTRTSIGKSLEKFYSRVVGGRGRNIFKSHKRARAGASDVVR